MDVQISAAPRAERRRIHALLAAHGILATAQRVRIAEYLFARDQHQTAEQVLKALVRDGTRIAKATVYNTLNLFAARGLIKALAVDPERCQFDSNTQPHYHFYVEDSGELIDMPPGALEFARLPTLPAGTESLGVEVVMRLRRRR